MSYINEALKKAQEQKDSSSSKYPVVPESLNDHDRLFMGKVLIYSVPAVILIFLIFLGYRWFNSSNEEVKITASAIDEGQELENSNTIDRKDLFEKAIGLYNGGRIKDAKKIYEAVVALDPGHIEALNNLGIIYIHERDFDTAKETLEKAVRLKPSSVEAYYNLACLYAIKGEIDQGFRYLEKAISLDENVTQWAADDSDLGNLKTSDKFRRLVAR